MPRSLVRALRLLLVCAVLALTSAPSRVVLGWFESIVQIDGAIRTAQGRAAGDPATRFEASRLSGVPRTGSRAPGHAVDVREARSAGRPPEPITVCAQSASGPPNAPGKLPVSRLHLRNSVLLC